MAINSVTNLANTGATAGFFTAGAGFIDMGGFLLNVIVFNNAFQILVRKGVTIADIHGLGDSLLIALILLQLRVIRK